MFFDDLNGLVFSIGNLKSYVGYLSSNSPCFQSDSYFATDGTQKNFFENLKLDLSPSTEIKSLLVDDKVVEIDEYVNFMEKMSFKIGAEFNGQPIIIVNKLNENLENERKQMAQILFEQKETPCLFFIEEAVSQLFASGAFTGVTINSGANSTQIKPVFEGYLVRKKSNKLPVGGETYTKILRQTIEQKIEKEIVPYYNLKQIKLDLLEEQNQPRFQNLQIDVRQSVKDFFTQRIVRDIKEPLLQNQQEVFNQQDGKKNDMQTNARLPDDTIVQIKQKEIKEMEKYIFENKQNFQNSIELPQQIIKCIMDCDSDMKRELLNKIYISGGNSLIKNFKDNVEKNLSTLQTLNAKIKVHSSSKMINRKMGPWLGASILGSTASFQNMWVSKYEYQEAGENIIFRKCLNQYNNFYEFEFLTFNLIIMKIMKILLFYLMLLMTKNESVRIPSPVNKCFTQLDKVFDVDFLDDQIIDLEKVTTIANHEINSEELIKEEAYLFKKEGENEKDSIKFRVSNKDPELQKVSDVMFQNRDISEKLQIIDPSFMDKQQVDSNLETAEQNLLKAKSDLNDKRVEQNQKKERVQQLTTEIQTHDQTIKVKQAEIEALTKEEETDKKDNTPEKSMRQQTIDETTVEKAKLEQELEQIQSELENSKPNITEEEVKVYKFDTEVKKYQKIKKFLEFEQNQFKYCEVNPISESQLECNPQFSDLKIIEISQDIGEFNVNTLQDSMRGVLQRLQLTTGKIYKWNNIKFNFDNDFNGSGSDRSRTKLDKDFVPLTYALKSLTNDVSSQKGNILNNMMITSIILKKVLVLLETASGIKTFQCPPAEGDVINENINENQNNMDSLFVENSINFDFLTKNQLEWEMHMRDYINKEKITTIKQDLEKGNKSETYNPSYELKSIMTHENSALPKSDIHTLNRPLEKLSRHNPTEDRSLACSSGMMRDFPILVPFLSEEMLGFQAKEEGGEQNFKFLYYYEKYGVRKDSKGFQLEIQQFFNEDLQSEDLIQQTAAFYEENGLIERVPDLLEKIIGMIKKVLTVVKEFLSDLFGFSKKKKKQQADEAVKETDNMTKIIEDIAIKANLNFKYENFQYNGQTINDNFNFFEEFDAKGVIDLMVNQREILDTVVDNYLTKRGDFIKQHYEQINENKQDGQPDERYPYQFEFDVYRIEALVKVNQFRLMTYLFRRLKFSPMVLPEGFELLQQESYKNLYQQHDELHANDEQEEKIKVPNKIELNIIKDKKPEQNSQIQFQKVIQMTENLSQNKGNRFKSKKHLVYSSFVKFMQKFFQKNFDENADLAACLVPHENMQRGNKCPIFMKDYIRTISENQHNKIEFNSIYNLFFDYFETNPETLEISVNEFVDQMFNFSRFFRNKEYFQMGVMDAVKIIKDKVIEFTRNGDIASKIIIQKIADPNVEKQFRSLVYSATLEDVGLVYPEFKYTSLEFLFTMLDQKVEVNEDNRDTDFKQKVKEQKAQNEREFQKLKQQLQDLRQDLKLKPNKILI